MSKKSITQSRNRGSCQNPQKRNPQKPAKTHSTDINGRNKQKKEVRERKKNSRQKPWTIPPFARTCFQLKKTSNCFRLHQIFETLTTQGEFRPEKWKKNRSETSTPNPRICTLDLRWKKRTFNFNCGRGYLLAWRWNKSTSLNHPNYRLKFITPGSLNHPVQSDSRFFRFNMYVHKNQCFLSIRDSLLCIVES